MKTFKTLLICIVLVTMSISCDDFLEVTPGEVLLTEDYLGDDQIDARSALFGVLAQMQEAAIKQVVWGEVRADLVDINANTSDNLRQLALHENDLSNEMISPEILFSIVNNCNFALAGIDTAAYEDKLLTNYVSLLRIRTWAQLQITINFGKLPFITTPINSTEDLDNAYLLLSPEQAMDSLINGLLPYSDVENASDYDNSLGFSVFTMIPDNDNLLGELYLWKKDYANAAIYYKSFLDKRVSGGGNNFNLTTSYGIAHTVSGGNYTTVSRRINLFTETPQTSAEVFQYIGYSPEYRQYNQLYSSLEGQIEASELINLKWSLQSNFCAGDTSEFSQGDFRKSTLFESDVRESIMVASKFQEEYFVYERVASVYLRLAEAINNAGFPKHALAIINRGMYNDTTLVENPRFQGNAESYLNFDQNRYYSTSSKGVVSGNLGIRGRAGLSPIVMDSLATLADSIRQVDMIILDEAALECAFEGKRWSDLIRCGERYDDPSIVADAVSEKFNLAGDAGAASTVKAKLQDPQNWFLPLDVPSNISAQE